MRFMKVVKQLVLSTFIMLILAQFGWAEIGYITNSDDTLENVAKKFHVTVEELISANNLAEDFVIHEGMRLVIPYVSGENAKTDLAEPDGESEKPDIIEYVVVRGDCLERIARDQGCDLDALLKINDLEKRSILAIGQKIIIPLGDKIPPNSEKNSVDNENDPEPAIDESEKETNNKYKKDIIVGVNADSISGKNLLDLAELDEAEVLINDLNIEKKTEDDQLKTSDKQKEIVKINLIKKEVSLPDKSNNSNEGIKGYIEHEIAKGDTVAKLSKKYRVGESSIYKINGISKRDTLRVGRSIKIPVGSNFEAQNEFQNKEESLITRKLARRDQLVNKALKYKGVRYKFGGTNFSKGVDCSGFTMKVYEDFGVQLPHSSKAQSTMGKKVDRNNLLPGDVVFFSTKNKGVTHCGIYVGDGKILHASTSSKRVQIDELSSPYFSSRYYTARRYI